MKTLPGLPLIGNLLEFRRSRIELLLRVRRECGDLGRMKIGPVAIYAVTAAELAQSVFVEHADAFIKSRGLQVARPVIGNGLLTSEHDFHKRQRKLIAPAFSHKRVAAYAEVMAELGERAQAELVDGETVDVLSVMMRLTLSVVGQTLFHAEVGQEASELGAALTVGLHYVMEEVSRLVHIPLGVPTPRNRKVTRAIARLDETVYRIIRERRASKADHGDVLSMLLLALDEEDRTGMTDQQVRDEAMTLFIAGHETTANALSWCFYLLSKNPEARAQLEAEADRVLAGRTATLEDLPKLPYALQVFKEAMRLYPPAYLVARQAERDVVLDGNTVPKGAIVLVNIFAMHRRADYFPDPERFDPGRFTVENEKKLPRGAYLPFGAGPRICIGNHFALMEGQILLATLAQRVRFSREDPAPVEMEPLITLRPKNGVAMRVTRRTAAPVAVTPSAR